MKQWQEKLAVISRGRKAFSYGVMVTFATGIVCSLIAFAIVWDLEKKKIAQEFEQDSADIAVSIERSMEKNLQNLESIVSFYNASEKLNQIFQPFEQANQSKSWLEGTGLGLAVSQQLIELMGSQLQVKSQLGVGTTFWFEVSFPIAKTDRSTKIQHHYHSIVGYQGKQRRLLIADDKPENQFALLSILKPLGFETVTANNGEEAVTLAQKIKPDLILIDLVMPFKSGFEAIQEIRQINYLKNIPIIALSSSILDSSDFNHQIAGSDAFLTKPVQEQQLLALLKRYLQLESVYSLITMDDYKTLEKSNDKITASKIIVPPPQDLEDLHELAMLGSMKKICEWAISLEKLDPKYEPFASELQKLAKSFQEKEIVNLVKQHLTQE